MAVLFLSCREALGPGRRLSQTRNQPKSQSLYKRECASLGKSQVSLTARQIQIGLSSPTLIPVSLQRHTGVVVVVSEFLMLSLARVTVMVGKEVAKAVSESEVSTCELSL